MIQLDKEDEKGEKIHFYYPKLLASSEDYLLDKIILEFGIRNVTEPNEKKHITPILSQFIKNNEAIEWPTADVDVLSPIRTLWEKATLIHVECSRNTLKNNAERLSRHWYDLLLLIHSWVGKEAITRIDLLQNVVHHKKIFYPEKYYDDCLNGNLRLVPENTELMKNLEKDFRKMIESGMFSGETPKFKDIMNHLKEFSIVVNNHFDHQ